MTRAGVPLGVVLALAGCHPSRLWTFGDNGAARATDAGTVATDAPDDVAAQPIADAAPDHGTDLGPADARQPAAACAATAIPVNNPDLAPACPRDVCDGQSCTKDTGGGLVMSYDIDCTNAERAWAVCELALGQDLTTFDTAYGDDGIIEVVFCVEGADLRGGLNLWYGRHPLRRKLALVLRDEVLGPGCYLRLFTPAQARFPDWEGIPATCKGQCGAGGEGCSSDFRAAIADYVAADGGGPDYDLHATRVQLAAEDCAATASGRVRLTSLRVLSDGCFCSTTADCTTADRPVCRRANPGDCGPWPSGMPPGVCGPTSIGCAGPPGAGVACTVSVGARACAGVTECVEGKYVCPVSDCD
ncbi:MAG TPA: hypothetical protein VIF57_17620 [Polyangia bacterium]|jgi:hypothetical protein